MKSSMVAGRPADRWGRRNVLVIIAVLYFISAVGSALAWSWISFLVFRFLGGIGVGGASVVSPMYIAEISPARFRGRLVAVTQFNIVLGILLAFFSNFVSARQELGMAEWRWMFGVEAVPAAVFFLLLFVTPRSPRWLISQGRVHEAHNVLARLGTDAGSVEEEIQEIQSSLDEPSEIRGGFELSACRVGIVPCRFVHLLHLVTDAQAVLQLCQPFAL